MGLGDIGWGDMSRNGSGQGTVEESRDEPSGSKKCSKVLEWLPSYLVAPHAKFGSMEFVHAETSDVKS
jgi:hypothetical protein